MSSPPSLLLPPSRYLAFHHSSPFRLPLFHLPPVSSPFLVFPLTPLHLPLSHLPVISPFLAIPLIPYPPQDGRCSQEALEEVVRGIGSNSRKRRLYSTVQARKMLSAPHPPLQEFLRAGILKPLIPHVQQREE